MRTLPSSERSLTHCLQTYLAMIPVITSFLPPTHTHLYLPTIFKLWEAFNSSLLDDRLIEFMGELSEEHVAGNVGAEGSAQWKDVGIWNETEWTVLMGKALGSMSKFSEHTLITTELILVVRRCASWSNAGVYH
jgi:hypothetical protein